MKRILFTALAVVTLAIGMSSCDWFKKELPVFSVESTISMDKEYMSVNFGENYKWFETTVVMKNYLDEETNGEIKSVSSAFEVVTETEDGYLSQVVITYHEPDSSSVHVVEGTWVEDFDMNDKEIVLTFKQAFDTLMSANCVKPNSRQCTLRSEVGPVPANPQYIFGNSTCCYYVDAVNGTISETNPVRIIEEETEEESDE